MTAKLERMKSLKKELYVHNEKVKENSLQRKE